MSTPTNLVVLARTVGLPADLEQRLVARLAAGAREYGDRSLDRQRSALLGEMVDEALDLIGWALVTEASAHRHGSPGRALALRHRLEPVVHQAGVIAGYLEHLRGEALAIETEHAA